MAELHEVDSGRRGPAVVGPAVPDEGVAPRREDAILEGRDEGPAHVVHPDDRPPGGRQGEADRRGRRERNGFGAPGRSESELRLTRSSAPVPVRAASYSVKSSSAASRICSGG